MVDPAKEIGGDLYDFYVRHNKLFFCVGDVSGKGVPAALVMAMTRSLFRSVSSREERPDHILTQMNRDFAEQNTQMMFLTLFLGVLDCETGQLDYCNAGHNAPVIMTHGAWRMLEVLPNLPLGIEPDCTFKSQHVKLHYGDVLFLYTDGLTEAENSMHEQFGDQRMLKTLTDAAANGLMANGYSPRHLVETMKAGVETFVNGAEQSDDLTMLAIRYQIPALVMRNDIEQIPTLAEWLEGLDIPAELKMPINLALEEAVSNVMLYAYPNNHGQVFLEFNRTDRLVFTLTDNGIPFDPTKQKEADTTLSAEERPIGGLGIFLVRQIMDDMQYERVDGKNILTLYKKI
jgi:sigma-B regulation protein RsbU (phosphoserine phosphatase)